MHNGVYLGVVSGECEEAELLDLHRGAGPSLLLSLSGGILKVLPSRHFDLAGRGGSSRSGDNDENLSGRLSGRAVDHGRSPY